MRDDAIRALVPVTMADVCALRRVLKNTDDPGDFTVASDFIEQCESLLTAPQAPQGDSLDGLPFKEATALDKALDALAFDAAGGAGDDEIEEHKATVRQCVRNIVGVDHSEELRHAAEPAHARGMREGKAQMAGIIDEIAVETYARMGSAGAGAVLTALRATLTAPHIATLHVAEG